MENILITGGSGYIGSELIKRLVAKGLHPHIILRKESERKRLSELIDKCKVWECDLSSADNVKELVDKIRPEYVFHLASLGVYSYTNVSLQNNKSLINSNVEGTLNLLNAFKDVGCKKFINTGSCFEYGSRKEPFSEDDICNPENLYGVTKVISTMLGKMFFKNYGLPVITVRPFTTYGPLEGEGRFITTVIKKCFNKENISLIEEEVVRDYIYIDDVVDGYLAVWEAKDDLSGQILNISTGISSALESTAKLIIKLNGVQNIATERGKFPKRPGEVLQLVGSAEKIRNLTGWKAKTSLEEGIKLTIDNIGRTAN